MEKTVTYQGYSIQSSPQYEADREKWRLCIVISVDDYRGIRSRRFSPEVLTAIWMTASPHHELVGTADRVRMPHRNLLVLTDADAVVLMRRATIEYRRMVTERLRAELPVARFAR